MSSNIVLYCEMFIFLYEVLGNNSNSDILDYIIALNEKTKNILDEEIKLTEYETAKEERKVELERVNAFNNKLLEAKKITLNKNFVKNKKNKFKTLDARLFTKIEPIIVQQSTSNKVIEETSIVKSNISKYENLANKNDLTKTEIKTTHVNRVNSRIKELMASYQK